MGGVMKPMSAGAYAHAQSEQHQEVDRAFPDPGPASSTSQSGSTGFGDLPESCIAQILRLVTPADVARLACTSRTFRDASFSDLVWQAKLPKNYSQVLAEARDGPPSSSKKAIYDYLSGKVFLKEGYDTFWIVKATGDVCRSQGARALTIVWGDDPRYWDWRHRASSSYPEVAYLNAVCWLEVKGNMECCLPVGTYTFSWRLTVADNRNESVGGQAYIRHAVGHIYGWSHKPVIFTLTTDDGQSVQAEHYMDHDTWMREYSLISDHPQHRRLDNDWKEYDVGDFTVEEGENGSGIGRVKLWYSCMEIQGGQWKSGMFVDGVVIRPKHLKTEDIVVGELPPGDEGHLSPFLNWSSDPSHSYVPEVSGYFF